MLGIGDVFEEIVGLMEQLGMDEELMGQPEPEPHQVIPMKQKADGTWEME
jgi:hypothetical protein